MKRDRRLSSAGCCADTRRVAQLTPTATSISLPGSLSLRARVAMGIGKGSSWVGGRLFGSRAYVVNSFGLAGNTEKPKADS